MAVTLQLCEARAARNETAQRPWERPILTDVEVSLPDGWQPCSTRAGDGRGRSPLRRRAPSFNALGVHEKGTALQCRPLCAPHGLAPIRDVAHTSPTEGYTRNSRASLPHSRSAFGTGARQRRWPRAVVIPPTRQIVRARAALKTPVGPPFLFWEARWPRFAFVRRPLASSRMLWRRNGRGSHRTHERRRRTQFRFPTAACLCLKLADVLRLPRPTPTRAKGHKVEEVEGAPILPLRL